MARSCRAQLGLLLLGFTVLVAADGSGRKLLKGSSGSGSSGSGSSSSSGAPMIAPNTAQASYPLGPVYDIPPSPYFKCPDTYPGQVYYNGKYPSSPWNVKDYLFKLELTNPKTADELAKEQANDPNSSIKALHDLSYNSSICADGSNGKVCSKAYSFDVSDHELPLGINAGCPINRLTQVLAYARTIPAPTMETYVGTMVTNRMRNDIKSYEMYGPAYSQFRQFAPCNGTTDKYNRTRKGVPYSCHHHGSNSMAPYDGWAEDETCYGEFKDYVYPCNRAGFGWYHDHALDITGRNANWGMAGIFRVRHGWPEYNAKTGKWMPAGDLWDLHKVEEIQMILGDKVFDNNCQIRFDTAKEGDAHWDNHYGDVNLVNGLPWPNKTLEPKSYRFLVLNAAVSRAYLYDIVEYNWNNNTITRYGNEICYMVAGDGGYRKSPVKFPGAPGLYHLMAERYEFVCDFSNPKFANKTLYLWNTKDDTRMTSDHPFFCYTHLLARFYVKPSFTGSDDYPTQYIWSPYEAGALRSVKTIIENVITQPDMDYALTLANQGKPHRSFEFGQSGGQWVINGETWHSMRIAASDVGVNTWEVWHLKTGGGWYHPIHIHLVDFQVIKRQGAYELQNYEKEVPKDVVALNPSAEVYLIMRFGAHKGEYMFHCHNLRHEDRAMMRSFVSETDKTNNTAAFVTPTGSSLMDVVKSELVAPVVNVTLGENPDESNFVLYDSYCNPDDEDAMAKPKDFRYQKEDGKWVEWKEWNEAYIKELMDHNRYRIFYPWAKGLPKSDKNALCGPGNVWRVRHPGDDLCAGYPYA